MDQCISSSFNHMSRMSGNEKKSWSNDNNNKMSINQPAMTMTLKPISKQQNLGWISLLLFHTENNGWTTKKNNSEKQLEVAEKSCDSFYQAKQANNVDRHYER